MGITVIATISEAKRAQVTVREKSRNSSPANPLRKTTGKKTQTVVRVEAHIAPATSLLPFIAASKEVEPSCRCR